MNAGMQAIAELLDEDTRYKIEAYQFVRESLSYANDQLQASSDTSLGNRHNRHLTGQQLCEACRRYALHQYGFLAKLLLNQWGVYSTSDLGDIVYNLIRIEQMRKSPSDRREDFDNVFEFETAFEPVFEPVSTGAI